MSKDMLDAAQHLVKLASPYCDRIEIAGSIRRGKPDPHDIEIVALPKMEHVGYEDLFSTKPNTRNLFEEILTQWQTNGVLHHRPDKNGRPAWGPRFKRATIHGVAVDIFSVLPPAQWGVIFAIRTGPADFNRALVTSKLEGGFMPMGMQVKDGALLRNGQAVPTPEEEDYFGAIGVPCWPPAERSLIRLGQWRKR